MGEAKVGEEFVTHEYEEAIAVQQCIVDAPGPRRRARALRGSHRHEESGLR
jgi:hypothetical protein